MMSRSASSEQLSSGLRVGGLMMVCMVLRTFQRRIGALEFMEWTLMMAKAPNMKERYLSLIWTVTSKEVSTGKMVWTLKCLSTMPGGADLVTQRAGKEFIESNLLHLSHYLNLIGEILLQE